MRALVLLSALALASGACRSEGGHDDHAGHEEPGDRGEHAGEEEHEEGIVELTPEQLERAGLETAEVTRQAVPFVLRTTARVDFDERRLAHVSPRIRGRVHEVVAELGDDVSAGETLAVVDSVELGKARARYLQAKAEADLARKTLSRAQRLHEQRISSQQEVIEARAAWRKAVASRDAEAEHLRLLGLTEERIEAVAYGDPQAPLFPLVSPIDGRVVDKHVTLGEMVTPERNVYTVADLSRVWIWIDVFEKDLAHVHRDDDVRVVTEAYPERTFRGEVAYTRDQVDPATRTAQARIDVDNPEGLLKPGMFAEVILLDPHGPSGREAPAREALAVPDEAVLREGDGWVAFVPVGEGRFERRSLRIGARTGDLVEILGGLEEGERVVVGGTFLLKSEAARHRMGGGHSH